MHIVQVDAILGRRPPNFGVFEVLRIIEKRTEEVLRTGGIAVGIRQPSNDVNIICRHHTQNGPQPLVRSGNGGVGQECQIAERGPWIDHAVDVGVDDAQVECHPSVAELLLPVQIRQCPIDVAERRRGQTGVTDLEAQPLRRDAAAQAMAVLHFIYDAARAAAASVEYRPGPEEPEDASGRIVLAPGALAGPLIKPGVIKRKGQAVLLVDPGFPVKIGFKAAL